MCFYLSLLFGIGTTKAPRYVEVPIHLTRQEPSLALSFQIIGWSQVNSTLNLETTFSKEITRYLGVLFNLPHVVSEFVILAWGAKFGTHHNDGTEKVLLLFISSK